MALDQDFLFFAEQNDFGVYNGMPILNLPIYFQNSDGTDYTFPGYSSAYLFVYQARSQSLLKSFTTQITRSSALLILNLSASDMTFSENGTYYYELGYIQSGGYTIPLRFGNLNVQ